jgi:hypothetical protein
MNLVNENAFQSENEEIVTVSSYSNLIEQPKNVKIQLKSHQLATIKKAIQLEENDFDLTNNTFTYRFRTRIGVIGDKVGSGKSLSVIGLIDTKPYVDHKSKYICAKQNEFFTEQMIIEKRIEPIYPTSLLIIPHGISKQWQNYLKDGVTSEFSYHCMFIRKNIPNTAIEMAELMQKRPQLIVVSNTMFRNFIGVWNKFSTEFRANENTFPYFSRLIIDEADSIDLSSSWVDNNLVNYSFLWFITSSITNIIHPYGHAIARHVRLQNGNIISRTVLEGGISHRNSYPGYVVRKIRSQTNIWEKIIVKNKNSIIDESFNLQNPIFTTVICKMPRLLSIINGVVTNDVFRLVASGNIEDAISKINSTKTTHQNLIFTITENATQELHNLKIEFEMKEKMVFSTEESQRVALQKISDKIESQENKIKIIKERVEESMENSCIICFDPFKNPTVANCCHKIACFECYSKWLNSHSSCPSCRAKLTEENLIIVKDKSDDEELLKKELKRLNIHDNPEEYSKVDNLFNILKKNPNGKFLIFAAFDNSINDLCEEFKKRSETHRILKGSSNTIQKIINDYKGNRNNVLLLNSTYFGSGLNLENTSDVIIMHKMDKDMLQQAVGRAQRFGRCSSEQLRVWNLHYSCENNI